MENRFKTRFYNHGISAHSPKPLIQLAAIELLNRQRPLTTRTYHTLLYTLLYVPVSIFDLFDFLFDLPNSS